MKRELLEFYKNENMGGNNLCCECRNNTNIETYAQTPYIICNKKYQGSGIMFVGKLARGDSIGTELSPFLEDVTAFGNEFIHDSGWPFYSYTREIIINLFGNIDDGLKRVSFANIVKCNNNQNRDTTDYLAKEYCINPKIPPFYS